MSELEDKLNSLLSNQDAMAQVKAFEPRSSTRCSPFCATSGATRSRGQRSSPSSSIWPRYF